VTFESGSRLERIEESAFSESGLKSIEIPSSVVNLGKWSFYQCKSLRSIGFESGSRLQRIGADGFGPCKSREFVKWFSMTFEDDVDWDESDDLYL
jgi:hypothetical protein